MLSPATALLVLFSMFTFIYLLGCIGSWLWCAGCLLAGHRLHRPTWDLSSLTRDQSRVLGIARQTFNHHEVPILVIRKPSWY